MSELKDILDYIEEHRKEFVEDLRTLLRQPSIAHTKEGIKETADMVLTFLEEVGAKGKLVQIGEGSPVVYAELKNEDAKKSLLVYNMYDVMPVTPKLWASPPWEARIIDGKIMARGAVNSKGPLMAQIEAVKAIMEVAKKPPVNLIFVIDGEEELGSPSLRGFIERYKDKLKRADAFVMLIACPEGEEELDILLGLKGVLTLDLEVNLREREVHSCYAPIVDNPVWRLIWAFNSMKDVSDKILIDGFYEDVVPISPDDMKIIEENAKTMDEEKIKAQCEVTRFRNDLHGAELLKELLFEPTLNIDGINAGYTGPGFKTTNPGGVLAKVDIRLVPNMREDNVLDKVKRHLHKHGFRDVRVTKVFSCGWAKSSVKEDIVQSSMKAADELGFKRSVLPFNPGTAPFYLFARPPLNLPFVHLQSLSHILRMHKPNEYITVQEYINTIKYFAALLYKYSEETI